VAFESGIQVGDSRTSGERELKGKQARLKPKKKDANQDRGKKTRFGTKRDCLSKPDAPVRPGTGKKEKGLSTNWKRPNNWRRTGGGVGVGKGSRKSKKKRLLEKTRERQVVT